MENHTFLLGVFNFNPFAVELFQDNFSSFLNISEQQSVVISFRGTEAEYNNINSAV